MQAKHKHAFTLLEVLVGAVVFLILSILAFQMISASRDVSSKEKTRMRALSECRFALDRLRFDLGSLYLREDLQPDFSKMPNDDRLLFYSAVNASEGERKLTSVEYRLSNGLLERGTRGADWSQEKGVRFNLTTPESPSITDFQTVAEGIIRFEFVYIRKSDGLYTNNQPDLKDIAGIIVGMAVIDPFVFERLSPDERKSIRDALSDPDEGQTPMECWQDIVFSSVGTTSIPLSAIKSLRFYQRTYSFL